MSIGSIAAATQAVATSPATAVDSFHLRAISWVTSLYRAGFVRTASSSILRLKLERSVRSSISAACSDKRTPAYRQAGNVETKADENKRKHRVSFQEAQTVFYDERGVLIEDPAPNSRN
jgi:hypothetical protein